MKQNPSQAAKLANKKLKDVGIQILDVANEQSGSSKRSAEIGNLITIYSKKMLNLGKILNYFRLRVKKKTFSF